MGKTFYVFFLGYRERGLGVIALLLLLTQLWKIMTYVELLAWSRYVWLKVWGRDRNLFAIVLGWVMAKFRWKRLKVIFDLELMAAVMAVFVLKKRFKNKDFSSISLG